VVGDTVETVGLVVDKVGNKVEVVGFEVDTVGTDDEVVGLPDDNVGFNVGFVEGLVVAAVGLLVSEVGLLVDGRAVLPVACNLRCISFPSFRCPIVESTTSPLRMTLFSNLELMSCGFGYPSNKFANGHEVVVEIKQIATTTTTSKH